MLRECIAIAMRERKTDTQRSVSTVARNSPHSLNLMALMLPLYTCTVKPVIDCTVVHLL